jgi:hypothetical protein
MAISLSPEPCVMADKNIPDEADVIPIRGRVWPMCSQLIGYTRHVTDYISIVWAVAPLDSDLSLQTINHHDGQAPTS